MKFLPSSGYQKKLRFFPPVRLSDFFERTPAVSAGDPASDPTTTKRFPLSVPATHVRHTFNGTAAIYQAAEAMGLTQGSKVLLPAYCCGAELGPFQHLQCDIEFYRINDNLQIDIEDVLSRFDDSTRLVYATHYYGLAQTQIAELAKHCRERNVLLLEDCALALYSTLGDKPLGSFGDYAIFSQRKFLPITEGGLLVSNRSPLPATQAKRPPIIPAIDRQLSLLMQGSMDGGDVTLSKRAVTTFLLFVLLTVKLVRFAGQQLFSTWKTPDVEGRDAVALYEYGMTRWSRERFEAMDSVRIARARREVFSAWTEIAKHLPDCRPLLDRVPEDACPLYFLLLADDEAARERLIALLESRGIEASEWWSAELEEIDWKEHRNLLPIKSRLVVVPTHHRIEIADLLRRFTTDPKLGLVGSNCGSNEVACDAISA